MKKAGLNRNVKVAFVDHNPIDTNNILNTHRYLMKETWHKIMFGIIKNMFIVSLTSSVNAIIIVNASSHTKCVSLCNQKFKIQCTLINLHPNEYSQELHHYPFRVKLDRCVGSCNTFNNLSTNVCVPNETKDLNMSLIWLQE